MRLFFLNCFYRNPPRLLLKTKRFANIEDSLVFSALRDLPETFFLNNCAEDVRLFQYCATFSKVFFGKMVPLLGFSVL